MPRIAFLLLVLAVPMIGAADATAAPKYSKLARVGVKAGNATVNARKLTVTLRLRQRARVELAVVDGRRVVARAKAKTLKKGRRRVVAKLSRVPSGTVLRLRITVKNLVTRRRGRGYARLRVAREPGPGPIGDENAAPSDVAIAGAAVAENQPAGTAAGTLSAIDVNAADVHAFALVAGAGDADNRLFTVAGSQLLTAAPLDFEQQPSRSVRVRVDDGAGGVLEKALTIAVTNVNEAPAALRLSAQTVPESAAPGTTVGVLEATDPDAAQTLAFSLVQGPGDTDNASFAIDGSALKTATALDFEAKASYTVRIQAADGLGGVTADQFSIVVTDTDEGPTVTMSAGALQYTENTAAVAVDDALAVAVPAGTDLTGATVRMAAGFGPGDVLGFVAQNGITGSYDAATGVLTLTGAAAPAAYEQALRSVTYRSTSEAPAAAKAVEMTLHAGPASGPPGTRAISVTTVNDPPVADADAFGGGIRGVRMRVGSTHADTHEIEVAGDVLEGDTDVDTPVANLTATPGIISTTDGGTVTMAADGSFTYDPPAGDDGSDSFTYTLEDNDAAEATHTATVTVSSSGPRVWFVDDSAPAGGRGVSHAPLQSLTPLAPGGTLDATDAATDRIFVRAGSYSGGIALESGQHLLGEAQGLNVGGTQLVAAAGSKPVITSTAGDVVDLGAGNEVRGIAVDPQGTGGGIFGGASDAGGTLHDVAVVDTVGTAGSGPGLELDGTSGAFAITGLTVTNNATGVRLNANTGTVDFGSTTITSNGAPGLWAAGTNMASSAFDAITVTGSAAGGVVLANLTGATSLGDGAGTDLSLTTSGPLAAFKADTVAGLTVGAGGTDDVSATGGPAVDVVNAPGAVLEFDRLVSTDSSTDGVNLDALGAGSFSAGATSAITGATGQAFDLNGGTGAISYTGTLGNGPGGTAEITGRTGGTATFAGPVSDTSDAGGGISVSGNSGGATTFSNASKAINSGTAAAVSFTGSPGHALSLTGGGLDVDSTSGAGLLASGSGSLVVTGAGNSVASVTGTAVSVLNTAIGVGGLVLESVSANGAANGVVLNGTGSAAGLSVTGSGATAGSGGWIRNTTGAGLSLTNTRDVALSRLKVESTGGDGVTGSGITNLSLTGVQLLGPGDADEERALDLANVGGTMTISGGTFDDAADDLVKVANTSVNLGLAVSGATFSNQTQLLAGNAIEVVPNGTSAITASITSNTFSNLKNTSVLWGAAALSSSGQSSLTFTGNSVNGGAQGGAGVLVSGQESTRTTTTITNNTFTGAGGNGVVNHDVNDDSTVLGTIASNTLTSPKGHAIVAAVDERADIRLKVDNNQVTNAGGDGVQLTNFGDDSAAADTSTASWVVTNNTVNGHSLVAAVQFVGGIGIFHFENDADTSCASVKTNTVTGTPAGYYDIFLQDNSASKLRFEEVPNTAATGNVTPAYIQSLNPGTAAARIDNIGAQYSNGTTCPLP